jgi:xanthine dehydrogenase accessory factor
MTGSTSRPSRRTKTDGRADSFPPVAPANVSQLCTQAVGAAIDGVRTGSFVVVMTHRHALDLPVVHAALASARFDFVG